MQKYLALQQNLSRYLIKVNSFPILMISPRSCNAEYGCMAFPKWLTVLSILYFLIYFAIQLPNFESKEEG